MKQWITLLFILCLCLPYQAFALSSDWQRDDEMSVRLISGVEGVGADHTISLGLDVQMAPDWHTYWRSPGMAGLPPQVDWQNSLSDEGNLKAATLFYPAPKRYTAFGLETVGYRDHVVFPIDATLRAPGKPLALDAAVSLLVCSATCVPKNYDLRLTVPAGDAVEGPDAALIKEFREQIPGNAAKSGLAITKITTNGSDVNIGIQSRDALTAPDIFAESDKDISFGAPVVSVESDRHTATFMLRPADTLQPGVTLAGMNLTLTIVNEGQALEEKVKVPAVAPVKEAMTTNQQPLPLSLAILFALIGGLILNLMPCVLPVLSLKVLSAIGHGGGEKWLVRRSFLMTAAGIVFSFLVLGGVTVLLKQLGFVLGWGVQFQQPVFLAALVFLLTLFAANMWGLLDIQLPRWMADSLGNAAYHPKLAGDFVTGAFATLLATPCSAPFLGTAVGFALAAGPQEIALIFAALGLGMSLPYITISVFPSLAIALPKPGAWMTKLRALLGIALAVTAVWLIWVLAAQITVRYAAIVGFCMTAIILLLAMRKTAISRRIIFFGLAVFALSAIILTVFGSMIPKPVAEVDKLWAPFSENQLAADIQEGKTVFVDVTADWCLTCKANQKFILSQPDIQERLFKSDVIAMQADWTNPDPVITDFLHKYRRYGIPFNIVFGSGAPEGKALPELLTHDAVMNALNEASRKP